MHDHPVSPHYVADITHQVLPGIFFLLFFIAGTIVLVYSLAQHAAIPARVVLGFAVALGSVLALWWALWIMLYCVERKRLGAWYGIGDDARGGGARGGGRYAQRCPASAEERRAAREAARRVRNGGAAFLPHDDGDDDAMEKREREEDTDGISRARLREQVVKSLRSITTMWRSTPEPERCPVRQMLNGIPISAATATATNSGAAPAPAPITAIPSPPSSFPGAVRMTEHEVEIMTQQKQQQQQQQQQQRRSNRPSADIRAGRMYGAGRFTYYERKNRDPGPRTGDLARRGMAAAVTAAVTTTTPATTSRSDSNGSHAYTLTPKETPPTRRRRDDLLPSDPVLSMVSSDSSLESSLPRRSSSLIQTYLLSPTVTSLRPRPRPLPRPHADGNSISRKEGEHLIKRGDSHDPPLPLPPPPSAAAKSPSPINPTSRERNPLPIIPPRKPYQTFDEMGMHAISAPAPAAVPARTRTRTRTTSRLLPDPGVQRHPRIPLNMAPRERGQERGQEQGQKRNRLPPRHDAPTLTAPTGDCESDKHPGRPGTGDARPPRSQSGTPPSPPPQVMHPILGVPSYAPYRPGQLRVVNGDPDPDPDLDPEMEMEKGHRVDESYIAYRPRGHTGKPGGD